MLKRIEDIDDELYDIFQNHLSWTHCQLSNQQTSTQTFRIRNKELTIHQNVSVLSKKGVTGTVVWDSSIVFSHLLDQLDKLEGLEIGLEGKVCMELGSGCGLVGLTLHLHNAKHILLTDQEHTLQTTLKNLKRNLSGKELSSGRIVCSSFQWEESTDDAISYYLSHHFKCVDEESAGIDCLVACDCIYNEHIVTSFTKTIQKICEWSDAQKRRTKSFQPTKVIIVQEMRTFEVFEMFLMALTEHFIVDKIDKQDKGLEQDSDAVQCFIAHLKDTQSQ